MKMLSVRQPWANLIAMGIKSIETRSWPTKYRGPLAIHAGKKSIGDVGLELMLKVGVNPIEAMVATSRTNGVPFGAIVATCELVEVLPIGDKAARSHVTNYPHDGDLPHQRGGLWIIGVNELTGGTPKNLSDAELQCGDFTPGRWAWLLKNVKAIKSIPWNGALGLPNVPDYLFEVKS